MNKVIVLGSGRMGNLIKEVLQSAGHEAVFMIDRTSKISELQGVEADAVIDFSLPDALNHWLPTLLEMRLPLISGTTGLSAKQQEQIHAAAKLIPILQASNFSIGIHFLKKALASISEQLNIPVDLEITESHHNKKIDAPSGTALSLAETIKQNNPSFAKLEVVNGNQGGERTNNIHIHALRGGNITGDHTVNFIFEDEILSLEHRALNRKIFAQGAVTCIPFLLKSEPGLYSLNDIFK